MWYTVCGLLQRPLQRPVVTFSNLLSVAIGNPRDLLRSICGNTRINSGIDRKYLGFFSFLLICGFSLKTQKWKEILDDTMCWVLSKKTI